MRQKNIKAVQSHSLANISAIELVNWPVEKVLALQTTCLNPSLAVLPSAHASPYGDFNLGLHVHDKVEQVKKNRNVLMDFISNGYGLSCLEMQWLEQVHGNGVVVVTSVENNKPVLADASITRQKNTALAIMTADCLPILLACDKGTEVAAIHGGWRSLAANIIVNTVNKMQSKRKEIVAWLGPCIGASFFEVGAEVKSVFVQKNTAYAKAFAIQNNGNYLADLHQIAKIQLRHLGINRISELKECTYENRRKYYSYRRQKITGRMATIICRK